MFKHTLLLNIGNLLVQRELFKIIKTLTIPKIYSRVMSEVAMPLRETLDKLESIKRANDEEGETTVSKLVKYENPRVKKRKYAILLAYSGVGYLGLQRNKGMKTIEEELLSALFKCNYISEEEFNQPQLFQFQRAARTDKGVSAIKQVLSAKLPENICVENVNEYLPDQIRFMGVKRVTKGFDCKAKCDARTYSYTMPSFALAPKDVPVTSDYRVTDEIIKQTNEVLKLYLGTHNYHNFTSRRKALDPSCQRYIMSFECDSPFVIEDMEFVTLRVKGQSFMLHQIRKMVGLAVAIVRGVTIVETINKAWQTTRIDISRAPGLGLLLEEAHYDKYNRRYGDDGMHSPVIWTEFDTELDKFRRKYILTNIVETEKLSKPMIEWLGQLEQHLFDARDDERSGDLVDGDDSDRE